MFTHADWATEGVTRMFSAIGEGTSVSFRIGSRSGVHVSFVRESRYSIKTYVRGSEGDNRTFERSKSRSRLQRSYRSNRQDLERAHEQSAMVGSADNSTQSEDTADRPDASELQAGE